MKKLLTALAVVAVLAGAYAIVGSMLDGRVRAGRQALAADGNPVTFEELDPLFAAGSGKTARVLEAAAAGLTARDLELLEQFAVAGFDADPTGARALLEDKASACSLLFRATQMEPAAFGMNIRDGMAARITTILPHFPGFRRLLLLQADALEASGRPDSALAFVDAVFGLSAVFSEPIMIYDLVATSGVDKAAAAAARIAPRAGTPAIERLVSRLERLDPRSANVRALQSEFVLTHAFIDNGSITLIVGAPGPLEALYRALPLLRRYAQVVHLRTARRQIEAAKKPWHSGGRLLAEIDSEAVSGGGPGWKELAGGVSVSPFYLQAEEFAAWRDVTLLGLRALVAARRTGIPPSLADFAPDAPPDRFSGRTYGYRARPDGFVVYSVGKDEADDGGDPQDDLALVFKL